MIVLIISTPHLDIEHYYNTKQSPRQPIQGEVQLTNTTRAVNSVLLHSLGVQYWTPRVAMYLPAL